MFHTWLHLIATAGILPIQWVGLFLVTEVSLFTLIIQHPQAWPLYTLLAIGLSTLGCLCDFWIGCWGGRPLFQRFVQPAIQQKGERLMARYGFSALIVGALIPGISYKSLTLLSGILRLRLISYTLSILVGRTLRLLILAWLVLTFGGAFQTLFLSPLVQGTGIVVGTVVIIGLLVRYRREFKEGFSP